MIKVFILFLKIKQWQLLPRFDPQFTSLSQVHMKLLKTLPYLVLLLGWKETTALPLLQEAADTKISTPPWCFSAKGRRTQSLFLFTALPFSARELTPQDVQEKHLNSNSKAPFKCLLNTRWQVKCWEHRGGQSKASGLKKLAEWWGDRWTGESTTQCVRLEGPITGCGTFHEEPNESKKIRKATKKCHLNRALKGN